MASIHVDRSARTFLALCECGWRSDICTSHLEALTDAVRHEHRAHAGEENAREALRQATRRRYR